jgi:hypothetical protein
MLLNPSTPLPDAAAAFAVACSTAGMSFTPLLPRSAAASDRSPKLNALFMSIACTAFVRPSTSSVNRPNRRRADLDLRVEREAPLHARDGETAEALRAREQAERADEPPHADRRVAARAELRAHHLRFRARRPRAASPTSFVSVLTSRRPRATCACPLRPSRMKRSSVAIRVTSDQGTADGLHSFRVRSQRERNDLAPRRRRPLWRARRAPRCVPCRAPR